MGGYAAVVLAGGAARRMGGTDKPARLVAGRPMRDRVLAAVPDADPRILVGPMPGTSAEWSGGPSAGPSAESSAGPSAGELVGALVGGEQPHGGSVAALDGVLVTREQPPGGGPVSALAAGLALLPASATVVALLAADLPLLTRDAVGHLLDRLGPDRSGMHPVHARPIAPGAEGTAPGAEGTAPGAEDAAPGAEDAATIDGVCFVDAGGRRQTLCGVWRVDALRGAVHRLAAERGGSLAGAPLRAVLAGLTVVEVPWSADGPPPWFDCDTDEDVRRAEEWAR
ncbi:NTP transferase domain-containing protein [Micromonospora sp. BQ11]|uniref:NTP transferase domain-containing protein n=1 Tax=Micromonospora sp. BQ11 TaxID=3452212 RepID=UPI003F8BAF3A